jgi:hypothetical protein
MFFTFGTANMDNRIVMFKRDLVIWGLEWTTARLMVC